MTTMEQNKARQDHQGLRLPSVLPSMDLNSLSLSQLLSEEALHAALEGVPADAVNKHASEGEDGAGGARDLATPPTALPDLLRRMSANMANGSNSQPDKPKDSSTLAEPNTDNGPPPPRPKKLSKSKPPASKRVFPGSAALKVLQEVAPREKLPSNAYKVGPTNLEAYIAAELTRHYGEHHVAASPFAQFANQSLDDEDDTDEDNNAPHPSEGWQQMLGAMQQHNMQQHNTALGNPMWETSTSGASSAAAMVLPHNSPGVAAMSPLMDGAQAASQHHDGTPLLNRGALRKRLKRRGKELLREAQLVAAQLEALNELEAAESGFASGMPMQGVMAGHVMQPHTMGHPFAGAIMPGAHIDNGMHGRY